MGRKKIQIQRITDERNRQVSAGKIGTWSKFLPSCFLISQTHAVRTRCDEFCLLVLWLGIRLYVWKSFRETVIRIHPTSVYVGKKNQDVLEKRRLSDGCIYCSLQLNTHNWCVSSLIKKEWHWFHCFARLFISFKPSYNVKRLKLLKLTHTVPCQIIHTSKSVSYDRNETTKNDCWDFTSRQHKEINNFKLKGKL